MKASSVHSGHVMACAAYLIGWHVLMELFLEFGVFDFMLPETGIEFGSTRMFVNERRANFAYFPGQVVQGAAAQFVDSCNAHCPAYFCGCTSATQALRLPHEPKPTPKPISK